MDTGAFTNALEIANSGSVEISKAQRESAESYLMALQSSSEGLNLSFHILTNEAVSAAARFFWATNTILYHLPALAGSLTDDRAEEMYQQLLSCIHRYFLSTYNTPPSASTAAQAGLSGGFSITPPSAVGDHIINKHAQVMVAGFQLFFPYGQWNRFLFDVLEMRRRASGQFFEDQVTMYVLRVLEYIDERVVSVRDRVDRMKEQRESDMKIKDAMREAVIPDLVEMWYGILFDSRSHRPEMLKLCLDVVKMYTEWIDITLLLDDRWINLLDYFLTLPLYRESVCECLLSLVNKKQIPEVKHETLLRLRVVEEIPKLMQMLLASWGSREEVGSLADAVAILVTAVASQLLALVDACAAAYRAQQHNQPGSPSLASHGESTLETLHLVVSYLIELTDAHQFELPMVEVLNFFQLYVKSPYFTQQEAEQLLDPLFKRTMRDGIAASPELVWDEGVIEDRKSILLVVRLIYRSYPHVVCHHVQHTVLCATMRAEQPQPPPLPRQSASAVSLATSFSSIQSVGSQDHQSYTLASGTQSPALSTSGTGGGGGESSFSSSYYYYASPPFLEATLRYVYEMGSAIKLETLKDTEAPMTQVIERLLRVGERCFFSPVLTSSNGSSGAVAGRAAGSEIPCPLLYSRAGPGGYATACAAVHLGFFETICRYHLFLVYHQDYLRLLLELLLLHPYGVLHSHERTRGRICSLLRQVVLALLSSGGGTSSPLLPYTIDMVKALHSIVEIKGSKECAPSSSGSDGSVSANDRRELYEAMGMLLTAAAVNGANEEESMQLCREQIEYIRNTLLDQLGTSSQNAAASLGNNTTTTTNNNNNNNYRPMNHHFSGQTPPPLPEDLLADCLSFFGAWAKGLRQGLGSSTTTSGAGSLCAVPPPPGPGVPRSSSWLGCVASALLSTLHTIGPIWHSFRFSSVVRERTGQFFGQLINTIPVYEEALEAPFSNYLTSSLSFSVAPPIPGGSASVPPADLIRLLRLLHQLVGKAGRRSLGTLQTVLPLLWESMKSSVGPLPLPGTSSPVGGVASLPFGVLSETCRECIEVYKNYFLLLVNAATFNCSTAVLTLPEQTFNETMEQLRLALLLPAELEVAKGSLQLFSRLLAAGEAPPPPNASNSNLNAAPPGAAEGGGGGGSAAAAAAILSHQQACEEAATTAQQLERLRGPILYVFVPTALSAFTSPLFDWRDAKNSFLSTEFALMAQGAVRRYGDEALQVLFGSFEPHVGAEAAQVWCLQLQNESKVTMNIKSQLRGILQQIQQTMQGK